jgi:toxin ParE1/3/4
VALLRYTKRARADLLDIWLTIALENSEAADTMFDRLEGRGEILLSWPKAGGTCPAIAPEARMLVERPYLILYRLIPEGVQIVRVLHGARDIGSALYLHGIE